MKPFTLCFLLVILLPFYSCQENLKADSQTKSIAAEIPTIPIIDSNHVSLISHALEASTFCKKKSYNTDYCFLVNMHIHSGKARFFIWDFDKNIAIDSGLVSHGCGALNWAGTSTADAPVFSNTYDSHCSSLGKYKIGSRAYSDWGIHVKYFLYGLDATNSNAYGRCIILHSWNAVSESEVYPYGTPEGWGCPAVSDRLMTKMDSMLVQSKRPVLLWTFN